MIACAKGIERGTHKFMTEVIAEAAPMRGRLSSQARVLPATSRAASDCGDARGKDETLARQLAGAGSATFRPYHSTDVRGVEIGGAAKNVLAIAAGIVEAVRASALAALTTWLQRIGTAGFLRRGQTLVGLSGLGDLT